MKYAYNDNGTLRDVVSLHPSKVFIPGYAELFIEVPDDAENGWIWNGTVWGPKTVSFTDLKAAKLQAVQAEKVSVRDGGLDLTGIHWDTDERAQAAYVKYYLGLLQDQTLVVPDWKASSGTWVEMNALVFQELQAALKTHESTLFTWQRQKEQEINDCETIEQLEAITVNYI